MSEKQLTSQVLKIMCKYFQSLTVALMSPNYLDQFLFYTMVILFKAIFASFFNYTHTVILVKHLKHIKKQIKGFFPVRDFSVGEKRYNLFFICYSWFRFLHLSDRHVDLNYGDFKSNISEDSQNIC